MPSTQPARAGRSTRDRPPYWACALLSFALSQLASRRADAAQSGAPEVQPSAPAPRAHLALVTGLSIGIGAMGVGGYLLTDAGNLRRQHAGLYVAQAGLTVAPFLAHGVVGEWGRGALFSIAPALATAAMAAVLTAYPNAPNFAEHGSYVLYPVPITVAVVGGAAGVVDAALVDRRARLAALRPHYRRNYVGVSWGGVF